MNTPIELSAEATAPNSIQLTIVPKARKEPKQEEQRFKVKEFINASKTKSYRVDGYKRDGTRVRENFADKLKAQTRQTELQIEWLTGEVKTEVQATKLNRDQIALAEAAFIRLGDDSELPAAIEYWITHGRQHLTAKESPRLDKAFEDFKKWLDETPSLRDRSKDFLRTQVNIFCNSVPNLRVSDFTPDHIDAFIENRNVATQTKINSRLAVSRFFSWCMKGKDRRWVLVNPCKAVEVEKENREALPSVLTVDECTKLMRAAEARHQGRMAPYIAVCLFGGLRPAEAARLTWEHVNLTDGEITVKSQASKTNKPRVVSMPRTLKAWLMAHKEKPFNPTNRRRDFDAIKQAAGYVGREDGAGDQKLKPWPSDVMRHTGVSHYFRKCKSFGETAEWAGNSESIIKRHYKGLVSSDDTAKFYAIMPTKKAGRK
jgi:integrase